MAASDFGDLPNNVVFDVNPHAVTSTKYCRAKRTRPIRPQMTRKKTRLLTPQMNGKKRIRHQLKLIFQQCCPSRDEVRKLHPTIKKVFKPQRQPKARYCILEFQSAKVCEEVRQALHMKHVEPYTGPLRCILTTANILKKEAPKHGLSLCALQSERLSRVNVRHIKHTSNPEAELTDDVKINSTARELLVRYGFAVDSLPKSKEHSKKKRKCKSRVTDEINEAT